MTRASVLLSVFVVLATGCQKQPNAHSVDYWCAHKKDAQALLKTQCTGSDNVDSGDCASARKAMMVCPNNDSPPRF